MNEILALIYGLIFGSFYNVCIYRLPKGESVINPPSHCGNCNTRLNALDLIPVFSYLFLRGKCRHCGKKYSSRYMLVELLTGGLFLGSYLKFGYTIQTLESFILVSIVIIVSFIDIDHHIILDRFVLMTGALGIIMLATHTEKAIVDSLYGFLLGGGFLFILALVGTMGGGDIKWMAALGIVLGFWATLLALFISFLLGGLIGLMLILLKIKSRKDYIPFGPFLGIGSLITFFYFNEMASFYLKFIGL